MLLTAVPSLQPLCFLFLDFFFLFYQVFQITDCVYECVRERASEHTCMDGYLCSCVHMSRSEEDTVYLSVFLHLALRRGFSLNLNSLFFG